MHILHIIIKTYLLFLIIILPSNLLAEIKLDKKLIMDISRTYGYTLGQNYSLDKIVKKYPSLRNDIFIARNEFQLVFGSSVKNMKSLMTKEGKGRWSTLDKQMQNDVFKFSKTIDMDKTTSIQFIEEVKQRAKGYIEEPVLQTLLLFKNGYEEHPSREFLDGFRYKYKNNGVGKSKGVIFSIEVPKTWTAKDGNRPNVVQKFVNHEGASLGILILNIPLQPNEVVGKEEIDYMLTEEGTNTLLPPNYVLVNKGNLTLENLNGLWVQYELEMSRVRVSMKIAVIMYMIVYQDKMIQIQGIVPISYNGRNLKNGGITKYEKLFDLMANTFVIDNLYLGN